jgi:HAE1 family hydrophobic/amphiphilic exporter-1
MNRMPTLTCGRSLIFLIVPLWLIIILGALPFSAAYGEEKGIEVLTLEDALRIAAEMNRDILKALEYRNLVEAIYVTERAATLPQIILSTYINFGRDESQRAFGSNSPIARNTRSAEVGLSQALFTWGQVGAAIRAAREGVGYADAQLRRFRQTVTRDVSGAFSGSCTGWST